MKTKSINLSLPIVVLCFLYMTIFSCRGVSNTTNDKNTSIDGETEGCLVKGKIAVQDESYTGYMGNLARLRAMMCGKYTQYQVLLDDDGNMMKERKIWAINNGEDSIVTYVVPMGDYHKIGYWIYYAQCLTTLPNEPVYNMFYELKEIDRDTIVGTHYRVPKDFKVDIRKLIQDPNSVLGTVNLDSLVKNGFKTTYIRQSLLKFVGETNLLEDIQKGGEEGAKYKTFFFEVQPQYTHYGNILFDENEKRLGKRKTAAILLKRAMVERSYLIGK